MEENLAIGVSIIFLHLLPKAGIKMQHLHPQKKRGKKKKPPTHPSSLIFSGEKVAVVDMTRFGNTSVGSLAYFALFYTLRCEIFERMHTHEKFRALSLPPGCEISLQGNLFQIPGQTGQESRLPGGLH